MALILLIHAATTLYMTGVIWVIQLVHYPMMNMMDISQGEAFANRHQSSISYVVGPAMLVEAATALILVNSQSHLWTWINVVLLGVIWLSTAALQVPCHTKLLKGFDEAAHRKLVQTNWIRTIAWSGRSLIILWLLYEMMPKAA